MRAVMCRSWNGVDGLTVEDVPPPPMVENGVRIRVGAAALNFADTLMVAGKYQVTPVRRPTRILVVPFQRELAQPSAVGLHVRDQDVVGAPADRPVERDQIAVRRPIG